MIRKILTSFIIITVIALSLPASEVFAADISVLIDGKKVEFNQTSGSPFIDQASRTQVPFRQTMEAFGCAVSWDSVNKIAIAEKDGVTVQVPIGAAYIIKDNQKIKNDTSALIKDNRTYLPIRAVLEAFGANVKWNQGTHQVFITSDATQNIANLTDNQTTAEAPILLNAIEPVVTTKEAYDGTEYLDLTMDYSSIEYNSINTPVLKLVANNTTNKTITAFEFSCKIYDDFDRPVYKVGSTDNTYNGLVQNTTLYGSNTDMKDTAAYYNYMNNYVDRNESSVLSGKTTVDKLQSDAINKMKIMNGFYRTNKYEFNLILYETASKVDDFKLLQVKYSDGTVWTNNY